jgi:hypothetical protein
MTEHKCVHPGQAARHLPWVNRDLTKARVDEQAVQRFGIQHDP